MLLMDQNGSRDGNGEGIRGSTPCTQTCPLQDQRSVAESLSLVYCRWGAPYTCLCLAVSLSLCVASLLQASAHCWWRSIAAELGSMLRLQAQLQCGVGLHTCGTRSFWIVHNTRAVSAGCQGQAATQCIFDLSTAAVVGTGRVAAVGGEAQRGLAGVACCQSVGAGHEGGLRVRRGRT